MSMLSQSFSASEKRGALLAIVCLLLLSLSPLMLSNSNSNRNLSDSEGEIAFTGVVEPWVDGGQPWPQPGRIGQRTSQGPAHSPDGGAGAGAPSNASELASVVDPVVNWVYGTYSIGSDALGTPVADFSTQIVTDDAASGR